VVLADNVTIDLNGFALLGASGSADGITVGTNRTGLSVFNGTLHGWAGHGLNADAAVGVRVERVLAAGNKGEGLSVGDRGVVDGCLATGNAGGGIRVGSQCVVRNNLCTTNGTGSGGAGILVLGSANRVDGNQTTANTGLGIRIAGKANLVVRNNAAYNGVSDYDIAPENSFGQLMMPGAALATASAWANFSTSCPPGQSFCEAGACADLDRDPNNCGACGDVCALANATAGCSSGFCVIASCGAGFADCNRDSGDGCEANLVADLNNCGACGVVCPPAAHGTPACTGGICVLAACDAGFADCNRNSGDGCEANLVADLNNCGTCGLVCPPVANGVSGCTAGRCSVAACNAGFADCNLNPGDGCEASLTTDLNNCGTCGDACNLSNATSACSSGSCTLVACNAGFADCNRFVADGCEANLANDPNHCGACGHTCAPGHACSNGSCL
jgi:hypothetical protein